MAALFSSLFQLMYQDINISACGIPLSFCLMDLFEFELISSVIAFYLGKIIFFNQNTMFFDER